MPRQGSAGARRRLDDDDRDRRRGGRPGHQDPQLEADALAPAVAAASGRCRSWRAQRLQPDVLSRSGRHGAHPDQLDVRPAVRVQAPTQDGLDRRVLLHHRNDDHDRLRRFQLREPAHLAAHVRHAVDDQRGDHHRTVGVLRRRRAAVTPFRLRVSTPPGASPAQPHRRRRA